jgi:hypothetical protein
MISYSGILYNASTEQVETVLGTMQSSNFIKMCVYVNGQKKNVELPRDARVFDLVCKVSDPAVKNIVVSKQTGQKYSYFDKVPDELLLDIVTTEEVGVSYQRLRDLLHVCVTKEAQEFIKKAMKKNNKR